MLLEVKVWGSATWDEKILPMLTSSGFQERPELHAADPQSDGELMYLYFELATDELPLSEVVTLVADIEKVIKDQDEMAIGLTLVRQR